MIDMTDDSYGRSVNKRTIFVQMKNLYKIRRIVCIFPFFPFFKNNFFPDLMLLVGLYPIRRGHLPEVSVGSPSATFSAASAGNILFITSVPTSPVHLTGTSVSNTIFVQASGLKSQTITSTNISQIAPSNVTSTSTTLIYLSSRQFSTI